MKRAALTTLFLLASTGIGAAQSSGYPSSFGSGSSSGLYTRGFVEYGYLANNGSDLSLAYGDFALGFGFGGVSSLPMGFELGVVGYAIDSGGSNSGAALFPVFWADTSVGRLSVGVPRSAISSAIQMPRLGGASYFSLELGSIINLTDFEQLDSNVNSYGLRFDGAVGSLDAGLSVHQISASGSDATSVTGYVKRDYGAFDFAVGFEAINPSGSDILTYTAQIGYDVGRYGGHLTVINSNYVSDVIGIADAFYKPSDWLTLNAGYVTTGGHDTFSVNAEASFMRNGYAGIGYIGDGSDNSATAYVGWKLAY